MAEMTAPVNPVAPTERIDSLDILRGFAILGILIMNIQSFSMIEAAYINPSAYGDLTGLNKWVWILSHIVADMKFMTLFSILFGAGIVLFSNKAQKKGESPVGLHYRRTFWLLLIGLAHAYLLWSGDILVPYALCALLVFLLQLFISPIWIRHFRFGPAEWLWRTLTYLRLQPIRNKSITTPPPEVVA